MSAAKMPGAPAAPAPAAAAAGRSRRGTTPLSMDDIAVFLGGGTDDVDRFRAALRLAPLTARVSVEREGVPAEIVKGLIKEIGVGTVVFQGFVGIPKPTFTKKMKEKARFGGTSGQSVVGLLDLINAVEDMLSAQKDNPEAETFDVAAWVGEWITRPQPALGGLAPAELMDTPSGRQSVMRVLGAIQSGAYQ